MHEAAGIGCAAVQIRAICRRRLDRWRIARPTDAADSSKLFAGAQGGRMVSATTPNRIDDPAGPVPYGGGSPGTFSSGAYGTNVALAHLALV